MKKLVLAAMVLLVCAGSAQAGPFIQPGTFIQISNGLGDTSGGEFNVSLAQGEAFDPFVTFCVQTNEYVNLPGVYYVKSITNYAEAEPDAGGTDTISDQTGWIYANYLAGNTFGGLTGALRADAVQLAIWQLENEDLGSPTAAQTAAKNAVLNLAYSSVSNVAVLNLYYTSFVGGRYVATEHESPGPPGAGSRAGLNVALRVGPRGPGQAGSPPPRLMFGPGPPGP